MKRSNAPEPGKLFRQRLDTVMIGQVKYRDESTHRVKVAYYEDDGEGQREILTDWLKVLCTSPRIPSYGSSSTESAGDPAHTHGLTVKGWFPDTNDWVLVLNLPADEGDGVVVGGITWK